MAAKDIDPLKDGVQLQSIESGAQDWAVSCGVCHVGGGQMEYDRNRNDYSATSPTGDRYYFEMPTLAYPAGRLTTVDASGGLSAENKAELDCLMCHLKTSDAAGSGNGRAWLQSMGCGASRQLGPLNDPACSGTSAYPGVPAAGPYVSGTAYDMYNRNLALKTKSFQYAASLGLGARVTGFDASGKISSIENVPAVISGTSISTTPESSNCSVCHARDDSTPGLPGMMAMKFGYGNFALLSQPGDAQDSDKSVSASASNDLLWFELGCKTGMGKRAHKIGQGPNANWGMSMFNAMFGLGKNPGDEIKTETITPANPMFASMKVQTKERMPDADVHDIDAVTHTPTGMSCGTCHYTLGSESKYTAGARNPLYDVTADLTDANSRTFLAGDHHGVPYPEETVRAIDHQFAQADSSPDTKSKNNLDGTVSCEGCHTTRTHARLTDNGGTLVSPTPLHAGMPAFHLERIACATCHIPEVYAAPGRLKYRDWTVGQYKGGFRNMLDWNFDLITGSHKTVPVLHQWLTKEGETKIYPVLPSVMPIWVKSAANSGLDTGSEIAGGVYPTSASFMAPVKARNNVFAAKTVKDANPGFDIRLNGGNMVPLFDGFSLSDSWEIDTKAEIDAMTSSSLVIDGGKFADKLRLYQTNFDVTHGVAPKEWALGGSKRGGCISCHSSKDPYARNAMGMPTGPNPNYSPQSLGFFEGYQQPLDGAGFGVGQYDMIKNWFALFADFDCTMMCGGGMQPDSTYFDPAGNPNMTAACGDPMGMGWTTLGQCVQFMAGTFDAAMGFPSGTAMMMGMYDGIAGLQGFTVRETKSGATLGCNPFAGAASMSPFPGYSVNNCMPSNNPMFNAGACEGANPSMGMPGQCSSTSFRYKGMCMVDSDCNGVTFSAEEYAANPNGLLYQRSEARSHFKIALQQSGSGTASKVTWPISVEKNPGNPGHMNSWDQALTSCKDMTGMPTPCGDGTYINTAIHANQLLGFTPTILASLMDPATAGVVKPVAAISWYSDKVVSRQVNFDASSSVCGSGNCTYSWSFGDTTSGTGITMSHVYSAAGLYSATLTVADTQYGMSSTTTVTVEAKTINTAPKASKTTPAVSGMTVSFTDTSTDVEDTNPASLSVLVQWGDGTTSTGKGGDAFSHAYTLGGTYTIKHSVTDTGGLTSSSANASVTITEKYSISGTVIEAGAGLTGVTVYLKQGTTTKRTVTTAANGTYSFANLLKGCYYVIPAMTGKTFTPAQQTVCVGPSASGIDFTTP